VTHTLAIGAGTSPEILNVTSSLNIVVLRPSGVCPVTIRRGGLRGLGRDIVMKGAVGLLPLK
jgi:hypothetical protein